MDLIVENMMKNQFYSQVCKNLILATDLIFENANWKVSDGSEFIKDLKSKLKKKISAIENVEVFKNGLGQSLIGADVIYGNYDMKSDFNVNIQNMI